MPEFGREILHICRIFRKSRTYLTIFYPPNVRSRAYSGPQRVQNHIIHLAPSEVEPQLCCLNRNGHRMRFGGGNTLGNDSPAGTNRNAFISIARSGVLHGFQRRTHRVYRPFSLRKAELDFSPAGWIRFELIGEEFAMRRLLLHFKMEKDIFPQPFCPVSTL